MVLKQYKSERLMEKGTRLHIFANTKTDAEPEHRHDFIELVYVTAGQALEYVDRQCHRVACGDLIFINYGASHAFTPLDTYSFINICFSPEVVSDDIIKAENAFSLLSLTTFNELCSESCGGMLTFSGTERTEIESILTAMCREYKEKQPSWHTVMESYLNILITKMLRKTVMGIRKEELGDVWSELSAYIDLHLGEELTLKSLASRCFYNPSYFSRVFKEKFGVSPVEYITRKRVDHAARLLCETDLTVDEISARSGFTDRSGFYRVFARYTGKTPSEYRKTGEQVKKSDK